MSLRKTSQSWFAWRRFRALAWLAIGGALPWSGGLISARTVAAEPTSVFNIFRASSIAEQVTDADLELKTEHGPWLILATSLTSQQQAQNLARELRKKFQLNAYVLPKQFDYSQSVLGSGIDPNGQPKRMRYANDQKLDVYGVLIGDFDSFDNPRMKETLERIKKYEPQSLKNEDPSKEGEASVSAYRRWLRGNRNGSSELAGAFVTRNPLLPEDYFQSPTVDKFVRSLNRDADYSLLDANGRFTVRIATFRGNESVFLKDSVAERKANSNSSSDALERAALKANLAAKLLRQAGFDAYEFHDRNMSIVTIGSFDALGSENAQGQFVYAPDIRQTIQQFGGAKEFRNSQFGPVPVAKTLLDVVHYRKFPELLTGSESEKIAKVKEYSIPLDLEPKAMAIPRPETSRLYSNALLGRN